MNKQLPASITKQQREAWDLVPWEGTINVEGDAAFEYFCQRLKWKLIDGADFRTWGVIGEKQDQITLLRRMQELGAIDAPDGEPELVCFPERSCAGAIALHTSSRGTLPFTYSDAASNADCSVG